MKYLKISFFITILGLFFIGTPQFNSNALIYDGVDYRIMETGTPVEVNNIRYNPIVINDDYGGDNLSAWITYMEVNNLHRVVMTASDVSSFYLFFGNNAEQLSDNIFKMELNYDTGFAYFYMTLYTLNEVIVEEIIFASTESYWDLPRNTKVLTDINFQSNQDIFEKAYNQGLDDGYDDGYDYGYDDGYDDGMNDYGYDDKGNIITGDNAFLSGYQKAIQESGDLKANIINFIPGVLGAIFMFFFQIGQIGILGITIIDVLGILVLISGLIFVIKFFF